MTNKEHKIKTWEVCYDYGPHMSTEILVQAKTAEQARKKAIDTAKLRGHHPLINYIKEHKMPRETKEQRLARIEQERVAREAQERAEYFPRVMALLVRATNLQWEIKVPDATRFELYDREDEEDFYVLAEYLPAEAWRLEDLEDAVARVERQREEAARKELARQVALNKLTEEERQLLGLKPYLL
jgi:hypothetical protein